MALRRVENVCGEVVLNRVASSEFPDTIRDVIEQEGQYFGRNNSYFKRLRPDRRCVELAIRLLEGERVIDEPSVVFQANFTQEAEHSSSCLTRGWAIHTCATAAGPSFTGHSRGSP